MTTIKNDSYDFYSLSGRLKRVSLNGESVFPLYFAALLDDAIMEAGMSLEPLLDIRCRGEMRFTWRNPALTFYANVTESAFEMRQIVVMCGATIESFDHRINKILLFESYEHDHADQAAKDIVNHMRRTVVLGEISNT